MALLLEKEITAEEIRETMFSMNANKAPISDGYTVDFFKASWSIVGEDVISAKYCICGPLNLHLLNL
jgi:hypothetical protein